MRAPLVLLLCFAALPAAAEKLTIDRIFAAPPLDGPSPRQVKVSPDGTLVTFLRPRDSDVERFDLWVFNTRAGETRMLVNSDDLAKGNGTRSAAAEALLERKRIVGTKGIVDYQYSEDGSRMLVPVEGDAWIFRLDREGCKVGDASSGRCLEKVVDTDDYETDFQLAPDNRHVAFVRGQNLVVRDLGSGEETAVTTAGSGTLSFGVAEFVAQEEMKRYTGFWWSPDGTRIAYTRVDESPVQVAKRVEYHEDTTEVVEQRYPYAGTTNARVDLFVYDLETGKHRQLDLGGDEDIYLYRVDWFPDGRHLAVQRQPRDLKSLNLLRYDTDTGDSKVLFREQSPIWIALQDNLAFVKGAGQFVWSSRRTGFRHLYLYGDDGSLIRPLTAGDWELDEDKAVAGVDPDKRVVYFTAFADGPTEKHLYVQSLDATDPTAVKRVTHGHGIHEATLSKDASAFVDVYDSPDQPPQIGLYTANGALEGWISRNALDDDHPYAPYLDERIEPEFGTLQAADGQDLYYRLIRPEGFDPGKRYPALVYVYGGPTGQQVTRHWPSAVEHWLQFMAERGYAVFTIDNRGTGNRGRAFDTPIYKRLAGVEVKDQLRGVEWLKSRDWVDPDRVGVFGWSYGGYMTLMLLAQSPGTFAAGVAGGPVTDWHLYDTYYTERFMDRPQDNEDGYRWSNVLSHAGNIADPLLLIHGMADDNVLFKHSTRLFKFLQDADIPFAMMTYPGAKHSLFRVPGTGPHAMKTATRYLDGHLLEK